MWWIRDPDRFKREVAGIDGLREQEAWLMAATPRLIEGLQFGFDFDVVVNGETYPFLLVYPAFFPGTPPQVIPRDGRQLSAHQYGEGGELCLEYRSDNWDPAVTGAMMITSAYRLIAGEHAPAGDRALAVPSEHRTSLGQDLRGWSCRFLLTPGLRSYVAGLPPGSYRDGQVVDRAGPNRTWVAYLAAAGPADAPEWCETGIPKATEKGLPALLVRVETLSAVPIDPSQESLDEIVTGARGSNVPPSPVETAAIRVVVVADALSARLFFSYPKDNGRVVISYKTVNFANDARQRLPESYAVLAEKKVGIIGCGSLGSKIAASLGRSGVGEFTLIDDDVMGPENLRRNELDATSLGLHKGDGLNDCDGHAQ